MDLYLRPRRLWYLRHRRLWYEPWCPHILLLQFLFVLLNRLLEVIVHFGVHLLQGPLFMVQHLLDEPEGLILQLQLLDFLSKKSNVHLTSAPALHNLWRTC